MKKFSLISIKSAEISKFQKNNKPQILANPGADFREPNYLQPVAYFFLGGVTPRQPKVSEIELAFLVIVLCQVSSFLRVQFVSLFTPQG